MSPLEKTKNQQHFQCLFPSYHVQEKCPCVTPLPSDELQQSRGLQYTNLSSISSMKVEVQEGDCESCVYLRVKYDEPLFGWMMLLIGRLPLPACDKILEFGVCKKQTRSECVSQKSTIVYFVYPKSKKCVRIDH